MQPAATLNFMSLQVCMRKLLPWCLLWSAPLAAQVEPGVQLQQTEAAADTASAYLLDTPEEYVFLEQQIHSGESQTAQHQLETIVSQIEGSRHRYHEDLMVPLTLAGDAHMVRQEYAQALDKYDRARHIARVSTGLFDIGQLPIVYREANAYRRAGDLKAASQREEYAYEVAKKAFGDYNIDGLPALYRLANFYIHINHYVAARSLYNRALAIHTTARQENTLAAVPALTGIARSHRLTRFPPFYVGNSNEPGLTGPTPGLTTADLDNQHLQFNDFPAGERALQKIVEIRQTEQPDDKDKIADAILDLADWHLMFERNNAAKTLYDHVYDSVAEDGGDTSRFDKPLLIYFPEPADPKAPDGSYNQQPTAGHVKLGFEVSPAGRVRKLKTLESVPDGLMDFRVRRSMRLAVYRPRLLEGVATETEQHTFTYNFTYYPKASDDVPEAPEQQEASEPAAQDKDSNGEPSAEPVESPVAQLAKDEKQT